MDMISVLNDCSVKCYGNVKSKEGPILFQKIIAKSITREKFPRTYINFRYCFDFDPCMAQTLSQCV